MWNCVSVGFLSNWQWQSQWQNDNHSNDNENVNDDNDKDDMTICCQLDIMSELFGTLQLTASQENLDNYGGFTKKVNN